MKKTVLFISFPFLLQLMCCSNFTQWENNTGSNTFIKGTIRNQIVQFPQRNREEANLSNSYFPDSGSLWLQAYKHQTNNTAYWKITFYDLNIESIEVPFRLTKNTIPYANISWKDTSIIKIDDERCSDYLPDMQCTFIGLSNQGEVDVLITRVSKNTIEGQFSGKLYLHGIGFFPFKDDINYVEVESGYFNMKFRRK